jgi:hypothetical protein
MAADVTYPSRPYHHRDGSFRVPSGSTCYVESGGYLNVQSGGTLVRAFTKAYSGTLATTGTVTITGTLTNDGTFTNSSAFTNTGTFTNEGVIANTSTFTNTGTITNSGAGKIVDSVLDCRGSSAPGGVALLGYGVSLIGSSTAGARAYKLNRPGVAGKGTMKRLICMGSTGKLTVISATAASASCTFRRTLTKFTFGTTTAATNCQGTCITLVAATSTDWSINGYSTAFSLTWRCT